MRVQDPGAALAWLDRARTTHQGRDRKIYDIWAAEIHARTGDPDAALAIYRALIAEGGVEPPVVLDAAEDLIANGYPGHAEPLVEHATAEARRDPDRWDLERIMILAGEWPGEDEAT
jgi:predicted Zn-dependent protease